MVDVVALARQTLAPLVSAFREVSHAEVEFEGTKLL